MTRKIYYVFFSKTMRSLNVCVCFEHFSIIIALVLKVQHHISKKQLFCGVLRYLRKINEYVNIRPLSTTILSRPPLF